FAAVEMRAEGGALVRELDQVIETEHLEAAAVGQDGPLPAHEAVQTAQPGDAVRAGAEGEVVGVAQQHLRPQLADFVRGERLDRRLRTDRHERRGVDRAVGGLQAPPPSPSFLRQQLEHYSLPRSRGRAGWGPVINMQSPKL